MGSPDNLPLLYQIYPGSIADVSTLNNLVLRSKILGIDIKLWIMDRGFFSANNLHLLHNNEQKFITPLAMHLKESKRIMATSRGKLQIPSNAFCINKETIFYHETDCKIKYNKETITLKSYVYLSEKRKMTEVDLFFHKIESIENSVKEVKFDILDDASDWLELEWKSSKHLFELNLDENGFLTLKRNDIAILDRVDNFGKMILVTNSDLSSKEVLRRYRDRDRVEKIYDNFKNGLEIDRIRTQSAPTMRGKIFIAFISLIIQSALNNLMAKKSKDLKVCSVQDLIGELKKITLFGKSKNTKPFLSEISKKQKNIFVNFNVKLPDSSLLTNPGI